MSAQKLLFNYAKRYPWRILAAIGLGFSGAVFNGVGTTLIVPAVFELLGTGASSAEAIALPPLLERLLEPILGIPGPGRAVLMLSFIVLTILLKNLANYLSSVTSEGLSRRLTCDLRRDGLDLLLRVDIDYHNTMRTGDIIQRLNDQIGRAVTSINAVINLLRASLNILFFGVVLLSISGSLTLAAVVLMAGVLLLNRYVIARAREYGKTLAEASKDYSVRTLEMLNGMRLVKATANEAAEFAQVEALIERREQAALRSQMNAAIIGPLNEILSILALVAIILISQFWLGSGSAASATLLLTFLFVLSRVVQFVGQLNSARSQLANSAASVDLVYDFLRCDNKPFMAQGSRPLTTLSQGITFEGIAFKYPTAKDWSLHEITLSLPKGTTLALVGASGAGKSTLADLLPRFYDPVAGRIAIDGVDLREFDLGSLRRAMGIVSQDTFLFNATVRDNIAYAQPAATDAEVVQAAQRANAYEFISQLPQGFDTVVGDRGVMLSGGQRQRIAIARALLQNPPILILDEATSALDTVSEQLVQAALEDLSRDRTTLVIAHRLSTIRKAHQIAVLDQGRVVELGTHEELLQHQGRYTYLYTVQFAQETGSCPIPPTITGTASYDLRSGLNVVLGSLQLLADGLVEDGPETEELIQEAYRAALNLLPTLEAVEKQSAVADQPPRAPSLLAIPNALSNSKFKIQN
ncbi:ABC transporter ATP-binding protein [Phormidium tenue]|uniref:ABC transporter ATP-binding protein n=1 Tax=Phormidium tenue NIES-30 TaxID=549789 RepID=A0A1U7JB83_9CYAN|nr:ABC transporter ATP-binding protein [Phormidium tenue]MBD2230144.1 ABC transporter ATP-binding protein [Phormidium tenue FACHB-1052]OKH51027.1 ABC transporter ATP-binding protein [Phormidium tenue NIES-30]